MKMMKIEVRPLLKASAHSTQQMLIISKIVRIELAQIIVAILARVRRATSK